MKAYLKSLRQLSWYFADMSLTCANTPSLRRRARFARSLYHGLHSLCCQIEDFMEQEKTAPDFSDRMDEIVELIQKFNRCGKD